MTDLDLVPVTDLIASLKNRNLSFLIAYVDHNEFHKEYVDEGIVWGLDSGGNFALQATLLRFLTEWMRQLEQRRCEPGTGE